MNGEIDTYPVDILFDPCEQYLKEFSKDIRKTLTEAAEEGATLGCALFNKLTPGNGINGLCDEIECSDCVFDSSNAEEGRQLIKTAKFAYQTVGDVIATDGG